MLVPAFGGMMVRLDTSRWASRAGHGARAAIDPALQASERS